MAFDQRRSKTLVFGGAYTAVFDDLWEYDGSSWTMLLMPWAPTARKEHAMVFDPLKGQVVLFGGSDGSLVTGDTWYFGRVSTWPSESCMPGFDTDGDGLAFCLDPDCAHALLCLSCGDGVCDPGEHCGSCPADCGDCTGCSAADISLSEVHGGSPSYVELVNLGSCHWDAAGLTLAFRLHCDQITQTFTFPHLSVLPPGGVFRAVELLDASMENETSTGAPICDLPDGEGWVMLCQGHCDLAGCGNVLDYFAKQGTAPLSSSPACASFLPAPLDVGGALDGQSATRVAFSGTGAAGLQSDWSLAPASRD